ncbi:MAG TPA: hypothetical protein DEG71_04880 [Clostridiales bacterium]|nr:hypothetical protein [Clostridiales bacterium]
MNNKINAMLLFDGISCSQVSFKKLGIVTDKCYASEIKKHAITVTQHHFPDTIQIGDINNIDFNLYKNIFILMGGSPCQDLSRLKVGEDRKGLQGEKSSLFFKYIEALHTIKPKYFLLENVIMDKDNEDIISDLLGVKPIRINSNLVSFQNRDRLYWTNIPNVTIPKDKNISFQDFKDTDYEYCKKFKVNKTPSRIKMYEKQCPNVTYRDKINCLTCKQDRRNNSGLIDFEDFCRYLTTRELELAQTIPIGYTSMLTKTQSENVLGDCWTVDVITHILKCIPELKDIINEQ